MYLLFVFIYIYMYIHMYIVLLVYVSKMCLFMHVYSSANMFLPPRLAGGHQAGRGGKKTMQNKQNYMNVIYVYIYIYIARTKVSSKSF